MASDAMEYRNLGRSGLKVSVVGLGCNNLGVRVDLEGTRLVVHKALDLGITLFDTADSYGNKGGSEELLGQALGSRRKDAVIATKFGKHMGGVWRQGASRRYIMSAVESSLGRLKTEWIDLYQIHVPDPHSPIEETLRALDDLLSQGKVRYIGCSNMPAWQVVEAQWTGKSQGHNAFVSCQDQYNLLARDIERDLLPAMQSYGLGLIPYSPLAGGLLSGKYRRGVQAPEGVRLSGNRQVSDSDAKWEIIERLNEFSEKRGHTLLELAFSWLAARLPVASIIAGATKPEQVVQNARAAAWKLSAEEMVEIDLLSKKS